MNVCHLGRRLLRNSNYTDTIFSFDNSYTYSGDSTIFIT